MRVLLWFILCNYFLLCLLFLSSPFKSTSLIINPMNHNNKHIYRRTRLHTQFNDITFNPSKIKINTTIKNMKSTIFKPFLHFFILITYASSIKRDYKHMDICQIYHPIPQKYNIQNHFQRLLLDL